MTSKEDLACLQQTMPTGMEGVKALEKFCREGNSEVKKLLHEECDVLLECRYCRNIFRSVINFISHKRAFCRASHLAVVMANAGIVDEDGRQETATKKRIGQMGTLTKRLECNMVPIGDTPEMLALYTLPRIMKELPTTTFADGMQKVIGSLPANLARKEELPDGRVCITMPQDNSSRYKEMSLRSRKNQNPDKQQHRELSAAEIKIVENFEKHDVRCGDFVLLTCDHPLCAHIRPFHSIQALAYHASVRHAKPIANESGDERYPCLLCCRQMWSLDGVNTHMLRVHPGVKEDHLRKRMEEDKTVTRGKKTTQSSGGRRARSLSVDLDSMKTEDDDDDVQEVVIVEEEGRGARRRGGRSSGRISALQAQPPQPINKDSRSPSGNSDDYGDPPVLQPADECGMEEEAEEDDDDNESDYKPIMRKKKAPARPKPSITPDELKEVKEEVEDDEYPVSTSPEDTKRDSVEGCLEDLLDAVCREMGDEPEVRRSTRRDNKKSISPPRSAAPRPSRFESACKKRGRPKKSECEKKEEQPKVGRPKKSQDPVKPKRQYIRKKDRESMEAAKNQEERAERERETASSEHSQDPSPGATDAAAAAAAAAEAAPRPLRNRKRPRWMVDGEEMVEEGEKKKMAEIEEIKVEEPDAEEEEAARKEYARKEEIKKKKAMLATPSKAKRESLEQSGSNKRETRLMSAEEMKAEKEIMLFTPRAGKAVQERIRNIGLEGSSSHKRKQNLGKLVDETEDIMIVTVNDAMNGPKKSDLTSVPVYLSEHQQQIFFSGLIFHKDMEKEVPDKDGNTKGVYECVYCRIMMPNVRDGRRHMVAHLRVMRLRCGLCGAGAFFCIDMRNHLQLRGCPELHKAPPHMIRPGNPCMTKEHADELTFVAHSGSPGRALFTSGKIVSIINNSPYLPDPVIEEKILGPTRVPPRGASPRKPAHKLNAAASVLKEAEKGMVSLAAVQRSPAAGAAAVAGAGGGGWAAAVLPLDDAAVHYYEDSMDPEAAAEAAAAAAAAAEEQRRMTMPPPESKVLRTIAEQQNGRAAAGGSQQSQPQQMQPAARILTFPTVTTSAGAISSSGSSEVSFLPRDRPMLVAAQRPMFSQIPVRTNRVPSLVRTTESYESSN